jgi:purine-binding chemotaxis protein CheW
MQSEKFGHKVVQQEIALDSYLRLLLDEIPSDNITVLPEQNPSPTKTLLTNEQVALKPVIAVKPNDTKVQPEKRLNPLSIMPEWTQDEFQALFFKLDNLILATPLTALLRTIKIEAKPTNIPGQPSWFMGLLDTNEQAVGILDTGQLIFGKTIGQQRDQDKQPFKSILITHDGKWGLVCDEILSIGKLEPEKVRWRTLRKKRPWLVGTVIEELTAVIDINQLVPHRRLS